MIKEHSITELYLYLKLDIWRSGRVANWGHVKKTDIKSDKSTASGYFVSKTLDRYTSFSPAKQLGIGLYLLDLHLVKRDISNRKTVCLAIVAVCKTTMAQIEMIHCLQIINSMEPGALQKLITDNPAQASMRKRKSPFRVSTTPRTFDASPIHSVRRKH